MKDGVPEAIAAEQTGVMAVVEPTARPTAQRGAIRPSLVCVSGADLGKSFRVGLGEVVIGRDAGLADIVLGENDVSRRHARFRLGNSGFEIEDLGSVNGTLLNGTRITAAAGVRVGDRIQIGRTVLLFAQHDELEERVARMQRLESMATLAGGIAHDFNNALAVVMCNLDLIERSIPAHDAEAREALTETAAAAAAATALARRLLRLGRAEPLPFGPVVLEQLATQAAAMARHRVKSPGLAPTIVVDVPKQLTAVGSSDELLQLVLNLCLNACDAMTAPGGRITITGRTTKLDATAALARQLTAGDYVELAVSDTGCGMDEATLARAFEPFFTTKPRDQGTGLGLAMIHSSVRRHGGVIDVQSEVGRGTTFRIALPRHM